MNLTQISALAQLFGLKHLELRCLEERLDLPDYLEETFGTPKQLSSVCARSGTIITVLDTSLKLIGNTHKDREEFLKFIPWAEALNVPYLRVFDGGNYIPHTEVSELHEAAKTAQWWQSIRSKNNWNTDIVIETHDAFCNTEFCLAFQSQLDTPCPILWDAHHTFHKAGEALNTTWNSLRHYIRHIHFKDSTTETNAVNDYTLALPGSGRFPIHELIDLIMNSDYAGAVCLEWERKWQPWTPPLKEALESLRDTLSSPAV